MSRIDKRRFDPTPPRLDVVKPGTLAPQVNLHDEGDTKRLTSDARHLPPTGQPSGQGSNQTNVRLSNMVYEASPKHHSNVSGGYISAAPTHGQAALDASLQIKPSSPRRVAVDAQAQELVVFDQTTPGVYHGHVRTFDQLTDQMKAILRKAGLVNAKGKITGAQRCATNSPTPSLETRPSPSSAPRTPRWSPPPWSAWSTATSILAGLRRAASTLRRALTSSSARPPRPAWATSPACTGA